MYQKRSQEVADLPTNNELRADWNRASAAVLSVLLALFLTWGFVARPALPPKPNADGPNAALIAGALDLNKSAWYELAQLPGIGENLARRMVEFRDSRQDPIRVSDLHGAKGIGVKTLQRIGPLLLE